MSCSNLVLFVLPDSWSLERIRREYPGAIERLEEVGEGGVLSIGGQKTRHEDDLIFEPDTPIDPYWWDPVDGCWMDVPEDDEIEEDG